MFLHKTKIVLSAVVISTLMASSLSANTSNDEIIKSIMKLRGDVESLYTNINENKEQYKSEMKSLSMQKADTEAQINRKTTSIKLAKSELAKIKQKISETSSSKTDLKPLLFSAITHLETSIKEGIPFKVDARVSDLEKIKSQINEGLITDEKALSLVWASYDDTIRLTKEIGLFKQQITLGGKPVIAKIAKVGSVMMFFSTQDNKVGYVTKDGTEYSYKVITNPDDITNIVALFDALQKQLRTGYFTLPNALVLSENK